MEEELDDAYVATVLKEMLDKTSEYIQNEAIVNRALTDKITTETINQKVNNQMNAISIGIRNINPKYNEKSKNYDITKNAILDSLAKYESALIELSGFYDGKIEQLILRKVELESHLLASIIREEYLNRKETQKTLQKDKDKLKTKISTSFKGIVEKIANKKKENKVVDVSLISKAKDAEDIQLEIENQLSESLTKTKNEGQENKQKIEKYEKEIRLINKEIKRINKIKTENLFNAMEVGDKWVTTTIKKPRTFTKIKRFFSSKFNTTKIIMSTIIEPLNQRIDDFVKNELTNVKG